MSEKLLEVKNVYKYFGPNCVLNDISISVRKGTIHALLGRNGAGKSTLVNIIAGVYPQTEGEVFFEGEDIKEMSIFDRQNIGIRLVPQHENSIPELSVAENIFLGLLPKKGKNFVDWKTIYKKAEEELVDYGLNVDPHMPIKKLSTIDARKINIIRAMHGGAKLIILDEPTTALTNKEREELFVFVRRLKERGTAFIFISHYLNEALQLSDEITVLRDGYMYSVDKESKPTEYDLACLVAGGDVELTVRDGHVDYEKNEKLVSCKELRGHCLENVSLDIFKGEIVGVIGFPESGAREFCRTLYGANKLEGGEVVYKGRSVRVKSPKDAKRKGIAYISYDRHREGLTPQFTVNQNIGMGTLNSILKKGIGFINLKKEREISQHYKEELQIKCNSIDDIISSLSGGNQQKVVVSRSLSAAPDLLILDEPTIGIDIKSREEIMSTVNRLTPKGTSVIYLTNDFEELLRIADRLVFFKDSRITAVLKNEGLTVEQVTGIRDQAAEAGGKGLE